MHPSPGGLLLGVLSSTHESGRSRQDRRIGAYLPSAMLDQSDGPRCHRDKMPCAAPSEHLAGSSALLGGVPMKSHVSQVLIVEDDDQGRLLLERILETEGGYEATPAASVVEARQFLLNHEYEAILIDVCLPAQSGIALLEYVHARHIDTAAIMVTGHDDRHLIEAAFANGAYGYVVKPFRVGELLISLANALHRRELEIHNRSHVRELEEKVLVRTRALHETLAPLGEEVLPPIAVEEVIERLSAALTVRHEESGAHIRRVSEFSALLADRAGLMTSDHAESRLASSLHDVGKMGLAAEAIPIVGRVVAIADVFDALTNDRVYRAASSVEEAVATMAHGRAKDFDPALLDAFLGSMDAIVVLAETHKDPAPVPATAEDAAR